MQPQYQPAGNRTENTTRVGGPEIVPRNRRFRQAEVLLPVDVSLSVRQVAHGPRAQLHHRRRVVPLPSHARLQRPAADGMGRLRSARRKCGNGQQCAAGEMDLRQHRVHEEAAQVARFCHRLGARTGDLHAGILSLEPVAVPAHAGKGHCLQEDRHGELGSRSTRRCLPTSR